jgi:cyclopropane-fatty-acyl-phospholipid synthase
MDDRPNHLGHTFSSSQTLVETMSRLCTSQEAPAIAAESGTNASGLTADRQTELEESQVLKPIGWMIDRYRKIVQNRLQRIHTGVLTVQDSDGVQHFGQPDQEVQSAVLVIRDPRFYRRVLLGGSLAAAESFIRGEWDSPDLGRLLQLLARNAEAITSLDRVSSKIVQPFRFAVNWLRRNTLEGSRKNISAHYDLSNQFFALMLDSSMTYSSAFFSNPSATLAEAQIEKYDRVCRKLNIQPGDQVLEIGTGWGGFAEHAVRNYDCHVTTTTISEQQYRFAQERFRKSGLEDRIRLLKDDYRQLTGQYDKLVSIEMIEAVGEKYLKNYFSQCSRLLRPAGAMCLQAITIPDHRYARYRRSVDFIQRYIFPGGFLPSFAAITQSLARVTDFRLIHSEDFAASYATTLKVWRANFWKNIDHARSMGFDQRWIRTWDYYLCYCMAGFAERQIGVSQIVLAKPLARY